MRVLCLVLLLAAAAPAIACDRYVLSGLAKHGDRSHRYNSQTWGVGCEWAREDLRWGVRLFDNSNRQAMLLPGVSWLPARVGPVAIGVSAGAALFGCEKFFTPAGALTAELMGRHAGVDLSLVPRALGMKGAVLWLNFKVSARVLE